MVEFAIGFADSMQPSGNALSNDGEHDRTSSGPPISIDGASTGPIRAPDDFFITYTKVDEEWAEWIAFWLETAGYRVVFQKWDFRPGENFALRMHQAAKTCKKTIMVLTAAYLEAQFTQPEWAARFAQDPTGVGRKLIPVRVESCSPDGLLKALTYLDLVGLEDELETAKRLLEGVRDGRNKPTVRPPFPVRCKDARA